MPAERPEKVPVPAYGAVPPVAEIVAVPLVPPKQLTAVCEAAAARAAPG